MPGLSFRFPPECMELVDSIGSKPMVLRGVWVRVPPPASPAAPRSATPGAISGLCPLRPAMTGPTGHKTSEGAAVWELARRQHGVITRAQLLEVGYTRHAISHRIARGRLHILHRGIFTVGRAEVDQLGLWMAAVLACGTTAVLSHQSAAELWEIRPRQGRRPEVSLPLGDQHRPPGVVVHRRGVLRESDRAVRWGIPVTGPACTLVDLAARLPAAALERAVNEADKRDLIDPENLRSSIQDMTWRNGVAPLRRLLDRRTFVLTDSDLERRFLAIARAADLPLPKTGMVVNGFRVDFFWPEFALVVETDGLRYHRTAAQQGRDRYRDQVHTAAGLTTLRFTHAQVRYEVEYVAETLRRTVDLLKARHGVAR
jgi:very-short-patch-repair endonuclease